MRWLPFQLNPGLPEEGIARSEYLRRKFGNPNRSYANVAAAGASVGIPFAFDRIAVQPNTVNAHRVMHYADQRGRQDEMAEELFRAYFIEGANLADPAVLADIGARAGFEPSPNSATVSNSVSAPRSKTIASAAAPPALFHTTPIWSFVA